MLKKTDVAFVSLGVVVSMLSVFFFCREAGGGGGLEMGKDGYGSKVNHQDMDRKCSSLVPFARVPCMTFLGTYF